MSGAYIYIYTHTHTHMQVHVVSFLLQEPSTNFLAREQQRPFTALEVLSSLLQAPGAPGRVRRVATVDDINPA